MRLQITDRGETYLADCPCCGDTLGRLAVNHRDGVRDPHTGWCGYELWKCHNEDCQQDRECRDQLRTMLTAPW